MTTEEKGSWLTTLRRRLDERRTRAAGEKRMVAIHRSMQRLIGTEENTRSGDAAADLYAHWGDPLDATRESFVRSCMKQYRESEGNIVMSSANLLTLVLGAVSTGDRTRQLWCLEHDQHWIHTLRTWLTQYSIIGTHIISAPLTVVGGLVRYQILTRHLPKNITMVICERTGAAPGSTLSTLLTVGPHLADEFTVFARRVDIQSEAPLIKRWAKKHGANFVVVDSKEGFVKLARRQHMSESERASFGGGEIEAARARRKNARATTEQAVA